jgi:hypothetical protein
MKRKIIISSSERTFIVSALMAYDASGVAEQFNARFEEAPPADPTDDGPEVAILRRKS